MLRIKIGGLAVDEFRPRRGEHPYPLFFIHGAGGTSRYLKNYLKYFAQAGWKTYAINLRGHNPSDRLATLAQVTIEDYIEDVEKVLRVLAIENSVLIGHSMGGLIAQKVATHIDAISGLVTIGSAPPLGVTMEVKTDLPYSGTLMKSMWGLMNMKPIKPTFFMAEKSVMNNIDPEERKKVFSMFVAESLVVGYQVAQGLPVDPAKIKCPKLVIGCHKDQMAPESMEQKLAEFLQADYISYGHFAHLPMLEAGWEESADDIKNWLRKSIPEKVPNRAAN